MIWKKNLVFIFSLSVLMIFSCPVFAGNPLKGAQVYQEHCASCHGADGQSPMANVPNFKRGEGIMKTDQELLSIIKTGKGIMPGFQGHLENEDMRDVIAHIRTLF
jgi:cytochrome c6